MADVTVIVTSTAAGDFTVAHGFGSTPSSAFITPTSSPGIWFQANLDGSPKMDATYLYLVASDAGLTASIVVSGAAAPVPSGGLYPTVEDIFNAVRVIINDALAGATGTQGEGRTFIDTWSPTITHLNLAIAQFKRDLENAGVTVNRSETFYTSIPPIYGALGSGQPDPAAQQYLGFSGFWDGHALTASPALPGDLIVPLEVWTRISGTQDVYGKISPAPDGLPSIYQDYTLGQYEWRGDAIYWNGSIVQQDLRLRYEAGLVMLSTSLSPSLFSTTSIGFLDGMQPLALYVAYIFIANKQPQTAQMLLARYNEATSKITNRYVKMKQRTAYEREGFGEQQGDTFGWFS